MTLGQQARVVRAEDRRLWESGAIDDHEETALPPRP
jgi:hypothetical protein